MQFDNLIRYLNFLRNYHFLSESFLNVLRRMVKMSEKNTRRVIGTIVSSTMTGLLVCGSTTGVAFATPLSPSSSSVSTASSVVHTSTQQHATSTRTEDHAAVSSHASTPSSSAKKTSTVSSTQNHQTTSSASSVASKVGSSLTPLTHTHLTTLTANKLPTTITDQVTHDSTLASIRLDHLLV